MKVCSVCRRCYDNFDTMCIEAAHPPLSDTHAGGRELVEGYSLDMLLESGVRGEVFKAHQLATNASCIIRLITTSEKERERIVREAKLAGAIFHPNVADIFEAGLLETGQVYVVSEYPVGDSLRQLIKKVRVPELLTAINILSQTAEALHTLHQNGITHNAVRPENIVLTTDADGQMLVRVQNIDHGGVGFRATVSNKFVIDSSLDSLRYFAPEQCTGESAGPQTDVYSLGIVFYELLTGAPPFDASTATALIHKQRNERPPDVRIANFQLRMLLTHALMESLQKQPMYRPASADKFARQMRHMEQLATHVSTPPPAGATPDGVTRPAIVTVPPPRPMPVVINMPEPATEPPLRAEPPSVVLDDWVSEPRPTRNSPPVVEPAIERPTVRETVSEAVPEPVIERPTVREAVSKSTPEPVIERPTVREAASKAMPEPVIERPVVRKTVSESIPEPMIERPTVRETVSKSIPEPVIEPPTVREVVSESMPEPVIERPTVLETLFESIPDPVHPVVATEPARVSVLLFESVPDAVPGIESEPVPETVSQTDKIPDLISVVEPEPAHAAASATDSMPAPLPVPETEQISVHHAVEFTDPIPDPLPVFKSEPLPVQVEARVANETAVDLARDDSSRAIRRSRLRTSKKKLHAMTSAVSRTPLVEKSALVVDAPETSVVDTPIEMSIVESTPMGDNGKAVVPPAEEPKIAKASVAQVDAKPAAVPVTRPAIDIPIELTTLEMPVEMTAEAKAIEKAVATAPSTEAPGQVTQVETRQTKPTKAPVRRKPTKRTTAKAPATDAPVKQVSSIPQESKVIAPETNAKPVVAMSPQPVIVPPAPEPMTMEPPRLVVEERVVRATPKKIEWNQPDDDIPSEADVLNALVSDGMIDESEKYTGHVFTVSSPKSADGPIASAAVAPPPPPPVAPAKSADGPVRQAVPANAQRTKVEKPAPIKKPAPTAESIPREAITRRPRPAPPVVVDQEEITLVRPPRQIRIDIERAGSGNAVRGWIPPRPSPDTDFFPTILGDRESPRHIQMPAPTEAMFSTYYSAPVKKTAIPYRTVMFGGGVLVLVVTFLIGDGFVGDHVQSKNESVAAKTTLAPRAKKVPPIGAQPAEKPRDESEVDENELKPLPDNDRITRTVPDKAVTVEKTAATAEKTATSAKKDTPKSTTRDDVAPARQVSKPSQTDSKNTRQPVQQPRPMGVKSSPPQTNPNIATRPRIVKEPK